MLTLYPPVSPLFQLDYQGKYIETAYTNRVFEKLINYEWLLTEKLDGFHVSIIYDGRADDISIFSKYPNRDSVPNEIVVYIQRIFNKKNINKIRHIYGIDYRLYMYGIFCGGRYSERVDYRISPKLFVFDVAIKHRDAIETWLDWNDIELIAEILGIRTVPQLGLADIPTIVDFVKNGFQSYITDDNSVSALGVVAKTEPLMLDKYAKRIMFELETEKFKEGEEDVKTILHQE